MGVPSTTIAPAWPVNAERVVSRTPFKSMASAPALRSSPSVITNCVGLRLEPGSTTETLTPGP